MKKDTMLMNLFLTYNRLEKRQKLQKKIFVKD